MNGGEEGTKGRREGISKAARTDEWRKEERKEVRKEGGKERE